MIYKGFKALKIRVDRGVAFVTIDNPPMNVLDMTLLMELNKFGMKVARDDEVKVIVFDSADPDFFISHFDVNVLAIMPDIPPPKPKSLGGMHPMCEKYRTMSKVSIAKIEGVARGGGSEFLLSLDMRFGAIGKVALGQPEIMVGIIPGGGSTQRLPRLLGRSRALEVILGGGDITSEVAELYGYINRALPPEELTQFVEDLAYRIASFPKDSIALAKKSVLNAMEMPIKEGLLEENDLFNHSLALPAAKARMKLFLESGSQSREAELKSTGLYDDMKEKIGEDEKYF